MEKPEILCSICNKRPAVIDRKCQRCFDLDKELNVMMEESPKKTSEYLSKKIAQNVRKLKNRFMTKSVSEQEDSIK